MEREEGIRGRNAGVQGWTALPPSRWESLGEVAGACGREYRTAAWEGGKCQANREEPRGMGGTDLLSASLFLRGDLETLPKLVLNSRPLSCLSLVSAGVMGLCYHTQL